MAKKAARNLTIEYSFAVPIHSFDSFANIENVIPLKGGILDLPFVVDNCTHVIAFHSYGGGFGSFKVHPTADAAVWIKFGAASAVNRPSQSEAIYYDGCVYYRLSHHDMAGQKTIYRKGLKLVRRNRLIYFLKQEMDPMLVKTIIDALPSFTII